MALFCAKHLEEVLKNTESYEKNNLSESLIACFFKLDEMMQTNEGRKELTSIKDELTDEEGEEAQNFDEDFDDFEDEESFKDQLKGLFEQPIEQLIEQIVPKVLSKIQAEQEKDEEEEGDDEDQDEHEKDENEDQEKDKFNKEVESNSKSEGEINEIDNKNEKKNNEEDVKESNEEKRKLDLNQNKYQKSKKLKRFIHTEERETIQCEIYSEDFDDDGFEKITKTDFEVCFLFYYSFIVIYYDFRRKNENEKYQLNSTSNFLFFSFF
mgnify:CR=1 FL=1